MAVTVVTHNLPARVGPEAEQATLNRLAETADILALQEAGWLVRNPDRVPAGFTLTFGSHTALPICYRSARFTLTGQLERRAYPATKVGSWGAGPAVMNAGWDYGIRLHDQGGVHVWVFNAHLVPSVQKAKPAGAEDGANWETRRRLFRAEIRQLVDITSWIVEPVVVAGDFNATPGSPLLAPMRDRFAHVTRPTHGDRAIDYLWHRAAQAGDVREIPTPSDHDALTATFTI